MQNQRLISFHSVTGLIAGIFILLLSLSGTVLVFHNEIDAFQQPMAGLTKTPQKNLTVDSCYNIVKQQYPHAMISSCNLPENEARFFSFTIYDSSYMKGTKALQLFVHPTTGRIENARGGSEDIRHNFMGWLAAFHSSFNAGKTGEWLLGIFAILFFYKYCIRYGLVPAQYI